MSERVTIPLRDVELELEMSTAGTTDRGESVVLVAQVGPLRLEATVPWRDIENDDFTIPSTVQVRLV